MSLNTENYPLISPSSIYDNRYYPINELEDNYIKIMIDNDYIQVNGVDAKWIGVNWLSQTVKYTNFQNTLISKPFDYGNTSHSYKIHFYKNGVYLSGNTYSHIRTKFSFNGIGIRNYYLNDISSLGNYTDFEYGYYTRNCIRLIDGNTNRPLKLGDSYNPLKIRIVDFDSIQNNYSILTFDYLFSSYQIVDVNMDIDVCLWGISSGYFNRFLSTL